MEVGCSLSQQFMSGRYGTVIGKAEMLHWSGTWGGKRPTCHDLQLHRLLVRHGASFPTNKSP